MPKTSITQSRERRIRKGGLDKTKRAQSLALLSQITYFAKKLTFWARGEAGGEKIAEFRIGGVGQGRDYPDSDTASIGPVILSKQWKEYEIDLRGKDLTYISGGFAWFANVDDNPSACTFYLDNIRFE